MSYRHETPEPRCGARLRTPPPVPIDLACCPAQRAGHWRHGSGIRQGGGTAGGKQRPDRPVGSSYTLAVDSAGCGPECHGPAVAFGITLRVIASSRSRTVGLDGIDGTRLVAVNQHADDGTDLTEADTRPADHAARAEADARAYYVEPE